MYRNDIKIITSDTSCHIMIEDFIDLSKNGRYELFKRNCFHLLKSKIRLVNPENNYIVLLFATSTSVAYQIRGHTIDQITSFKQDLWGHIIDKWMISTFRTYKEES